MENVVDINYLVPKQEYKVFIKCFTYNQSKYIEDALKGFAMQQTNFPFACLVMDDASTDGEQDVIRTWMEYECDMSKAETFDLPISIVIIVPHKTNRTCTFVFYLLKENIHGKGKKDLYIKHWREKCEYEAICEGDDYWIDPLKLQKQVDFLENNQEYMMCCSDAVIQSNGKDLDWCRYSENCKMPVEDVIMGGGLWIQTASLIFRKELSYAEYPKCHVGDYPLQIYAALSGGIYWLAEKQVVYRYQTGDSWTSFDKKKILDKKKISGWQSEIEMLEGMDSLSNGVYHSIFKKRISVYVWGIIGSYRTSVSQLTKIFSKEIKLFNYKQKLRLILLRLIPYKVYNLLSILYHKFL